MSRGTRKSSHERRFAPLVWGASAVAALVLTLGVNGTLSSWSQAVISNSTNTAATAQAVILQEAQGATTCLSSASTTNSSSCATINKYGGVAIPLTPGTSQTATVTFTNVGSANASSFVLAPSACSQTPTAGTGTVPATSLCTTGDLTVAISCSPGSTYSAGSAWTDLVYAAAAPLTATKTHTAAAGDLNVSASWTCQFTVALSASAPVNAQGIVVSQALVWTLNK